MSNVPANENVIGQTSSTDKNDHDDELESLKITIRTNVYEWKIRAPGLRKVDCFRESKSNHLVTQLLVMNDEVREACKSLHLPHNHTIQVYEPKDEKIFDGTVPVSIEEGNAMTSTAGGCVTLDGTLCLLMDRTCIPVYDPQIGKGNQQRADKNEFGVECVLVPLSPNLPVDVNLYGKFRIVGTTECYSGKKVAICGPNKMSFGTIKDTTCSFQDSAGEPQRDGLLIEHSHEPFVPGAFVVAGNFDDPNATEVCLVGVATAYGDHQSMIATKISRVKQQFKLKDEFWVKPNTTN